MTNHDITHGANPKNGRGRGVNLTPGDKSHLFIF